MVEKCYKPYNFWPSYAIDILGGASKYVRYLYFLLRLIFIKNWILSYRYNSRSWRESKISWEQDNSTDISLNLHLTSTKFDPSKLEACCGESISCSKFDSNLLVSQQQVCIIFVLQSIRSPSPLWNLDNRFFILKHVKWISGSHWYDVKMRNRALFAWKP